MPRELTTLASRVERPADRSPLAELLALALPTVVQMAGYTLMQFADGAMLAWYGAQVGAGDVYATAVSNAGLLAFVFVGFGMGVMFCVNALVSQRWGAGRPVTGGRVMWQGVWLGVALGLALVALLWPTAPALFRAFGHSEQLAASEATFLRLSALAFAFKLAGASAAQFLLGAGRPVPVLLAGLASAAVFVPSAWALIWGRLGLPEMGLAGSAWAMNLAIVVECALLFAYVLTAKAVRAFGPFDWKPRVAEMKELLAVGAPSGLGIVADIAAWAVFSVGVIGVLGDRAMAANTYAFSYMKVSFMPAFGVSQAVTALVGRYMGAGDYAAATHRALLGLKLCMAYMMLCGLAFFLLRRPLIDLLTDDPTVIAYGASLLVVIAVYQIFDALYVVYIGALRGVNDTLVPAVVAGVLCWALIVGGGYWIALAKPEWGPLGPWGVGTLYGALIALFMYFRFAGGTWQRRAAALAALAPQATLPDSPAVLAAEAAAPVPAAHPT